MPFRRVGGKIGLILTSTCVLTVASCSDGRHKTYPVSGQVLYNGEPLKGVSLAFHPGDPKRDIGYPAHAKTDEQGRFKLTSYVQYDGAPEGDYKVALAFEVEAIEEGGDQSRKLPFQVPVKYHRKETTDINVTVKPGANDLEPIRLNGPPLLKGR